MSAKQKDCGLSNLNLGIFLCSFDVCWASKPVPSVNYASCWRKTLKYSDTCRQDVALRFTDACKLVVESWCSCWTSNSLVLRRKTSLLSFRNVSMLDALFASRNSHPLLMLSEHILELRKNPNISSSTQHFSSILRGIFSSLDVRNSLKLFVSVIRGYISCSCLIV